jgi:uncharacterized protein (TIGR03435 family)
LGPRGDRFTLSGGTVRTLLTFGYRPSSGLGLTVIGAPGWMESDRFDIEAKADCSAGPISETEMVGMVQSLLESRFHLKAHWETRETTSYDLVIGKGGPKMKLSEDQTPASSGAATRPALCGPPSAVGPDLRPTPFNPNARLQRGGTVISGGPNGTTVLGFAVPLSRLISTLQQQISGPVTDRTGLQGLFDFKLQFSPAGLRDVVTPFGPIPNPGLAGGGDTAATPQDALPSMFTAIQEQLGLKLESSRGTIEVLVIDSIEKPASN